MKLKLVGDDSHPAGVRVVDAETGEPLQRVRMIKYAWEYKQLPRLTVEVLVNPFEAKTIVSESVHPEAS